MFHPEKFHADILDDPVVFAQSALNHQTWATQEAILRSIRDNERTAVKACHSSSKTFLAAEVALWWTTTFEDGVVLTTAPTDRQVKGLVWREIRENVDNAAVAFSKVHDKHYENSPKNYAVGMSTRSDLGAQAGVRMQGFKGANLLIICDEAPGIANPIYEAMEGIAAGGRVHWLLIGNPTIASGYFYDVFNSLSVNWTTFTIDAFDTPNLEGVEGPEHLMALSEVELDVAPWPFLVTRRWLHDRYRDWVYEDNEEESPRWMGRARGKFPRKDPYQLIWLDWLERARINEPTRSGRLRVGVDVAGDGEDETVCYVLDKNGSVVDFAAWSHSDPRAACVKFLRKYQRELEVVNVDSIGQGYYFEKHLKDAGLPSRGVNVSNAASKERYLNLKAEAYYQLRQAFEEDRVSGLTDETTIAQLSSIRTMETDRGKTAIEPKKAARRRGVKSPDRAEALMLANFRGGTGSVTLPGKDLAVTAPSRPT